MVNLRACLKKDNPKSTGSLPFPLLSHVLRQFFKGYHHLGITIPLRIRGITIAISLPRYTIRLISPGKKQTFQSHFSPGKKITRPKVFIRQESEGTEGLVGDVEGGQQCGDPVCGDCGGIFVGSKLRITLS